MPATAERILTVPHNLAGNWIILQEIQQKYLKTVFSNSSQGDYTYFGLPWGSYLKGLRRWIKAETFVRGWTIQSKAGRLAG